MDGSVCWVFWALWLLGGPPTRVLAASDSKGTQPSSSSSSSTILQALHCPPCERIHCSPQRTLKLTCTGGITPGVCGCCPTCAKLAGESCGGSWDYLGRCDEGLVCVHDGSTGTEPEAALKWTCKSGMRRQAG